MWNLSRAQAFGLWFIILFQNKPTFLFCQSPTGISLDWLRLLASWQGRGTFSKCSWVTVLFLPWLVTGSSSTSSSRWQHECSPLWRRLVADLGFSCIGRFKLACSARPGPWACSEPDLDPGVTGPEVLLHSLVLDWERQSYGMSRRRNYDPCWQYLK